MQVQIRYRGVDVAEQRRDVQKDQIRRALRRFARRIGLVRVSLWDANGPRGGRGIRCRIVVELPPHGRVIVAQEETDVGAALTGAASRVRLAVARHLKRRTERRRPSRRRPSPRHLADAAA